MKDIKECIKHLEFKPGTFNILLVDINYISMESLESLVDGPSLAKDCEIFIIPVHPQPRDKDWAKLIMFEQLNSLEGWVEELRGRIGKTNEIPALEDDAKA